MRVSVRARASRWSCISCRFSSRPASLSQSSSSPCARAIITPPPPPGRHPPLRAHRLNHAPPPPPPPRPRLDRRLERGGEGIRIATVPYRHAVWTGGRDRGGDRVQRGQRADHLERGEHTRQIA